MKRVISTVHSSPSSPPSTLLLALHRPLCSFISTVHSAPSSPPSTLLLHLHRPLVSFISTVHSSPSSPPSTLLLHLHRPLFYFVSSSVLCSKMMRRLAALILILGPLQGPRGTSHPKQ
ncbi:hypothetical protein GDO78_020730 [Eleutherodactylus coqui]|uniref:Uncharacterized protein n=1 Tax=Eleutherodactylus coqui TaxID=57060 RepID=A0A8J6E8D6_ELECQ|nr:hypothetical protein GDO78_020730 [Eleutherodactylus coqui]